jgi:DNA-binding MarR family transcriptional regulator
MANMSASASSKSNVIREPIRIPEPEHGVARAMREVMHAFRTIMEGRMRERGPASSFAHALVMFSLAHEPGLSGAQAARRAQVTAQTMNGLLRTLEAAGYVVREQNPENRRADRWFLTRAGLRHLEFGKAVGDEVTRTMLIRLTSSDVNQLCTLLNKCARALQANSTADSVTMQRRARRPRKASK